ncbi:MAG: acyltransferase family protein [Lachnospiraceae bacterium]|nr:acyltransferase family protein [Lachnospiraceae bacterium]
MNANKRIYMEFLRIIACLFVLFNHSCGVVITITQSDFSKSRIAAMLIFYLCKTAVPLFIMIAGANLLSKCDSREKYFSRIKKIMFLLIVFSLFYHVYYNHGFSLKTFLYNFYMEYSSTALWYLYLYLGLLLMLPILQRIHLSDRMYLYLIILYCIGPGLIPFLCYYWKLPVSEMNLFSFLPAGYLILFLLGDYMENRLQSKYYCKKGVLLAWAGLIGGLLLSLGCSIYQLYSTGEINNDYVYGKVYFTPTVLLSLCIFYLAKYYCGKKIPSILSSAILKVGSCTLGIYLLGDFLRMQFACISDFFKARTSELVSVLLFDASVFFIGFLITMCYSLVKNRVKQLYARSNHSFKE